MNKYRSITDVTLINSKEKRFPGIVFKKKIKVAKGKY